jgi:hypothetical protein
MASDGSSEGARFVQRTIPLLDLPVSEFAVDHKLVVHTSLQALFEAAGLKVATYVSAGEFLDAYERGTPGLPDPERPAPGRGGSAGGVGAWTVHPTSI